MSSSYSTPPTPSAATQPLKISAGTAVKIGFFGALGATLFSLILSVIGVVVVIVLALLGVGIGSLIPNMPR